MPTTDSTTLKDRKVRQPVLSLVGHRYGKLRVMSETSRKGRNRRYICECDCGRFTVAHMVNLRSGGTRSCGCLRVVTLQTHGHKTGGRVSPAHAAWKLMRQRCLNPSASGYHNYGGRGIKICERWDKFENFFADMGHPPFGYSLDRIDNDGDYEPSNCRWATSAIQHRNNRRNVHITFNGETKILADWATQTGISPDVIQYRLKRGWGVERALTTPPASECIQLRKSR